MHYYDFGLVGLRLRVESPFPISNFHELSLYLAQPAPELAPDAFYRIRYLPEGWKIRGEELFRDRLNALYRWGEELHRYYFWNPHRKEDCLLLVQVGKEQTLYVPEKDLPRLLPSFRLSAFFALEQLLLEHRAFQLHASVVEWQGKGILFSAPSGTGKSTQAELWRLHAGAEILNGDRGMLRWTDGAYRVYGSPYAGSSGIYTNRFAPVRVIVTLEQGEENTIRRLNPVEAFQRLYREVTVSQWDRDFVDRVSEELLCLIAAVPVYHLTCRPDQGAVDVLLEVVQQW